jgi:heme-degrading monooxygenase HmoA
VRRVPWKAGPEAGDGPVFVSVTDFRVRRYRDLPRVWLAGLRLRRAWPEMPGAVGMWLWAEPSKRRGGSVSVWRSPDDLDAFVRWPPHLEVMRRFRSAGEIEADSWEASRCERREIWARAQDALAGART